MDKYSDIQSATDLITEIAAHGLSPQPNDITRATDLLWRFPIFEFLQFVRDNKGACESFFEAVDKYRCVYNLVFSRQQEENKNKGGARIIEFPVKKDKTVAR